MTKSTFRLMPLPLALLLLARPALGLESLTDDVLSEVNGRAGLDVRFSVPATGVAAAEFNWEDVAGTAPAGTAIKTMSARTVNFTPAVAATPVLELKLDVGSSSASSTSATLAMEALVRPFLLTSGSVVLVDNPTASMGSVAFQTSQNISLKMSTVNGIFNSDTPAGSATFQLSVPDVDFYLTHALRDAGGAVLERNQYVFGDVRLDLTVNNGRLFADTGGIYLGGTFSLPATASQGGLDFSIFHKGNVAANSYSTSGAGGWIRFGASGNYPNASFNLRSDVTNVLGEATAATVGGNTVGAIGSAAVGTTGFAWNIRGEYQKGDIASGGTSFDLAEAGANGYGLRFSNMVPLKVRDAANANFSLGDFYVNQVSSNSLLLPVNLRMTTGTGVAGSFEPGVGMVTAADYRHITQKAGSNSVQQALVFAMRDLEVQAIPQQTVFIGSTGMAAGDLPTNATLPWALAPLFYDLDANFVFYGDNYTEGANTRDSFGFGLGMSMAGRNADGSKISGLFLVDAAPNPAGLAGEKMNRYIGFRNIDVLLTARGNARILSNRVNFSFSNFNLALAAEFGGGYLPTARLGSSGNFAPANAMFSTDDVLFGLRLRISGTGDLDLLPGGNTLTTNFLGYAANMLLTDSYLQIVEPVDSSKVGFDTIQGRIQVSSGKIDVNKSTIAFENNININPNRTAAEVMRIKDVNFYPAGGTGQRLGELAITGGTLFTSITMTPR